MTFISISNLITGWVLRKSKRPIHLVTVKNFQVILNFVEDEFASLLKCINLSERDLPLIEGNVTELLLKFNVTIVTLTKSSNSKGMQFSGDRLNF